MTNRPLDYETPPAGPPRPSSIWTVVRLAVAVPFVLWGCAMVVGGAIAMLSDHAYAAQFLWGIALIAVGVAAVRVPVHRRRA